MADVEADTKATGVDPKVEDKSTDDGAVGESKGDSKPEEAASSEGKPNVLKTKGKIDYDNPRSNRKFDPSKREVSDDPVAIRKQVEFYFGDWNFPQDKFMWEQAGGSENKPIPVKTIHSFKRMRTYQPYSAVVSALRDSSFLNVSGEEGEELVGRKTPYKPMPTHKAKTEAATVYVKGFGDEDPNTQFDLESFFAKFGEVSGLKLRRTPEGFFKGSVFVTFADEETAKQFLALDPAPKWKEHDLKVMSKHDYCEEKSEMIRQGKLEPSSTHPNKFYEGNNSSKQRKSYRGDRDDWKKRRDHDQKHGFRDHRGGGRGRGGRGRGDRDRGDRDRREHNDHKNGSDDTKPEANGPAEDDQGALNGKRAREEDASTDEPAAKKVDAKTEVQSES